MKIKINTWKFLNGYADKDQLCQSHVRKFCKGSEYNMFMLVSHGVLEKIRHEPDVAGFCVRPTFSDPYKLYTVGLSIDNIQSMLDKYDIEAIMCPKKTINIEY